MRILDSEGRIIVEVRREQNDRSIRLFSEGGQQVASLGIDGANCGYLALRNGEGHLWAYLSIEMAGGRLLLSGAEEEAGVAIEGNLVC